MSRRNGIQGPRALDARTLTAHFVPEPFATSQDEWLCPAATDSRDRRHSEKSNPGQDPAQPSLAPQGAGGARRCGWELGGGGGWQTHRLGLGSGVQAGKLGVGKQSS